MHLNFIAKRITYLSSLFVAERLNEFRQFWGELLRLINCPGLVSDSLIYSIETSSFVKISEDTDVLESWLTDSCHSIFHDKHKLLIANRETKTVTG